MCNNVLRCLVSRASIGIGHRGATDRLRDCNNATLIGDYSAEIGDDTAGFVDVAVKWSHAKLHPEPDHLTARHPEWSMYKYLQTHNEVLKLCITVLVRVPINNYNYKQPIAFFVILLAMKHLSKGAI